MEDLKYNFTLFKCYKYYMTITYDLATSRKLFLNSGARFGVLDCIIYSKDKLKYLDCTLALLNKAERRTLFY